MAASEMSDGLAWWKKAVIKVAKAHKVLQRQIRRRRRCNLNLIRPREQINE
jgi:hypothetical protein